MKYATTAIQLCGLVCLVIAGFIVHVVAGLVVLGASLLLLGYLMERPIYVQSAKNRSGRGQG